MKCSSFHLWTSNFLERYLSWASSTIGYIKPTVPGTSIMSRYGVPRILITWHACKVANSSIVGSICSHATDLWDYRQAEFSMDCRAGRWSWVLPRWLHSALPPLFTWIILKRCTRCPRAYMATTNTWYSYLPAMWLYRWSPMCTGETTLPLYDSPASISQHLVGPC